MTIVDLISHKANNVNRVNRANSVNRVQRVNSDRRVNPANNDTAINARVIRRLAAYGSGWIPWGPDGADLVNAIPRLRQRVADAGGDPGFQVQGHAPVVRADDGSIDVPATMDAAAPMIEAGVTDLRMPASAPSSRAEALEVYGTYVAEFRSRFS